MGVNFFIIIHEFWKGFRLFLLSISLGINFCNLSLILVFIWLVTVKKPFLSKDYFSYVFVLFLDGVVVVG